MKWIYLLYLFRPVNFYGCKSVNLLTTSVPHTGDGGGGGGPQLLYIVFMFINISCKHMDVLEYPPLSW